MRQMAAVLIVLALFAMFVGSRFTPADGDKLAAVSRMTFTKVRGALPAGAKMAAPVQALRRELPERVEDRVKSRLDADKRFEGVEFSVSADGGAVRLQGVVADPAARKRAVALAENTVGVEKVVDELAVPE